MARHCVATGAFPRSRWPRRGNVGVSVMPSSRACGARPSAGGQTQRGWPHGGKPGDNAEGDFPGGTRSPRPQIRAGPKPGHVIATHGSAKGPWPKRGNVVVCVMPSLRACGARPSRGTIQGKMALWGKARKWRQGWFSRRGAVSAPALRGLTHARTFHYPRWVAGWP
jgi:hypothetical protein